MPFDETYPKAIVFIVGERTRHGATVREAIGTGFIVGLESQHIPGTTFYYVMTAAHCVRTEDRVWIRIPVSEEEVRDFRVRTWVFHPKEDIAATPFERPPGPWWRSIPTQPSMQSSGWVPQLGDRVYFFGLMSAVPEMADRNIPLVRSGTVAALYQERVPVKVAPDTTLHYTAHLVDCRSYKGFSGSPCFVQREEWRVGQGRDPSGRPVEALAHGPTTFPFGMVIAHIEIPDEEGDKANSGVAVLVPIEKIEEVLDLSELREDREQSEREHQEEAQREGAVPDVMDREFSKQTFEGALRRVSRRVKPVEPDEASSET